MKKYGMGVAAATVMLLSGAQAAAPALKTQAPGYYRMTLGDFEITTVLDGSLALDPHQLLTNVKPEQVDAALKKQFLTSPVETSINTFLINTGTKLVLVDTGANGLFGPTTGRFVANLKAAGYTPDQIDDVVITHMHGDHIGGLTTNGKRTFPNAVVHADRHDVDYFLSTTQAAKHPGDNGFKTASDVFKAYIDAQKFTAFEAGEQIVPGVKSIAAHGHTPGHTIYAVESQGQKLVLWGDLLHVAAVQFPEPTVTISFDVDSKLAEPQREKALADAAAGGYWVGVAHVPFPAIGHVRKDGTGYAWVPINYSPSAR